MNHLSEDRINDLVDGLLPAAEHEEAERHLARCAECAAEVEGHRALLRRLAAVPRRLDPGEDLRPGIRARIGMATPGAPAWRQSLRSLRYPLAAAAVVLVVLSSSLTLWLARAGEAPVVPVAARPADRPGPVGYAGFQAMESGYAREVAELQRALAEQRELLDPATVRLLERNLAVIDRAIAESRAALRADPHSGVLQQMLLSTYRQKVEILRRAAELGAAT